MKKVILLMVLMLLASAVVIAGEYEARVWNTLHWRLGDTWDAELSFEKKAQPVADDFIRYIRYCGGYKVHFDFKGVQPWSEYKYLDVLRVDNKKPYDVNLTIEDIDMMGCFCGQHLTIICDGAVLYPDGESVTIPANGDVQCDFILESGPCACPGGHHGGIITWKATAP